MITLNTEQKREFSKIIEEVGNTLDITETQYSVAVQSYQAVGNQLSKEDSLLRPYEPEILPQGSFLLGTMIQPIAEGDELDIDLVCQLKGKNPYWTQQILKNMTGDQLKKNDNYKEMLEEKRRCWKLEYRRNTDNFKQKYHMDVLPSIVDSGYKEILEKAFSATTYESLEELAIRITDWNEDNYPTETNHRNWLKSNPFGYARWFYNRANIDEIRKSILLSEAIRPVPKYSQQKLPLQRVIQILKRHRDIMWKDRSDKEDKPISIIITTLAAKAYSKETDVVEALINVVSNMERYIIWEYSYKYGRELARIENPVNSEENFADKWPDNKRKEDNFKKWMQAVKADLLNILQTTGKGYHLVAESMKKPFGEQLVQKAFSQLGKNMLTERESGALKMAAGTGMLGSIGRTNVPQHKPFGNNE